LENKMSWITKMSCSLFKTPFETVSSSIPLSLLLSLPFHYLQ
jgi:hypothetical protein